MNILNSHDGPTDFRRQPDYWEQQLAGMQTLLTLPTDFTRPITLTTDSANFAFTIDEPTTKALRALNRDTRSTMFMTVLAAFNVMLGGYSGQNNICVGSPATIRNSVETDGTGSSFPNMLPLHTTLDNSLPFSGLLEQIRTTTLGAYAHQDLLSEILVEAVQPERYLSYLQLFQAILVVQDASADEPDSATSPLHRLPILHSDAKFDLSLTVAEQNQAMVGVFEYKADLFRLATIERMATHFTCLLEAAAKAPSTCIGDLLELRQNRIRQSVPTCDTTASFPAGITASTPVELDRCLPPNNRNVNDADLSTPGPYVSVSLPYEEPPPAKKLDDTKSMRNKAEDEYWIETYADAYQDSQNATKDQPWSNDHVYSSSAGRQLLASPNVYETPEGEVEKILATICKDLLGIDEVGLHDNFFELGGHSLLAVQGISKLRDAYQVEVSYKTFFDSTSLQSFAQAIAAAKKEQGPVVRPRIQVANRSQPLPMSFAQQRLWFLDQLEPGGVSYNMPMAARLNGEVNHALLQTTLNSIVERHEVLRTTFAHVDNAPIQVIADSLALELPLIDVSALPLVERQAKTQEILQNQARTSFDLNHGPLLRVCLIRLDQAEHILCMTFHHIIFDGWSISVLLREISLLYLAHLQAQPSPLPVLDIQYADYACWQRKQLTADVMRNQLEYWAVRLQGAPALLLLPTDRVRPAVPSHRGDILDFIIPSDITAGLRVLSQKAHASLFMALAAALNVLLFRYSGQNDICLGTPIANRNSNEVEPLIGFFVNTLVLRTLLDSRDTFNELLNQVRKHALDAYANQDVPFEHIVEAINPERDLSYSPVFQVMLVMENESISEPTFNGMPLKFSEMQNSTAKFDLTLRCTEDSGTVRCSFEYRTDLFDRSTIERTAGHFNRLLESAVADPSRRISELDILTTPEHEQLTRRSQSYRHCRNENSIHEIFQRHAMHQPDAIAVIHEGSVLTYGELNAKANRLAHYLRTLNVGPDSLVGICVERSHDMIIGLLAVLKAGGAYVPLDPTYPKERLAFMISDSRPIAILTQENFLDIFGQVSMPVLRLDTDSKLWQHCVSTNPSSSVGPNNLAYIIYTSGSTGKAKGALLQHNNVLRLFEATHDTFHFNSSDTWTLFHSYSFDFSVWEIWGALLYGGKLVIVPYLVSRSPELFYSLLIEHKVTVLNQTPSAFNQIVQLHANSQQANFPSLRYVIFGGEAMNEAMLEPWFAVQGDLHPGLINMYGITETTVHVTIQQLRAARETRSSVGRPISDLQVYILDDCLNPVPVGIAGELHIVGPGLARGYLNRQALTAEKFIPNPFNSDGTRMYKSGDLGRYLPDGRIEYLGRIDNQVKIRGFRIELGEIESALGEIDGVRDAIVLASVDNTGEKRLVAYVVLDRSATLSKQGLREALTDVLPNHMVPTHIVLLENFPLTTNGKIDRNALPAPGSIVSDMEYEAPSTHQEAMIAAIWADVLKVERVGMNDNFFALGGDSIRTINIVAKARDQGIEINLEQIFRHQTVRDLCNDLSALQHVVNGQSLTSPFSMISLQDKKRLPLNVEDAYPLSRLQLGMVFHNDFAKQVSTYHDVFSYCLQITDWELGAFRTVLNAMTSKHPILRTCFRIDGFDTPLQLVMTHADIPLSYEDISHLQKDQQAKFVELWIQQEGETSFDLGSAPLLRIFVHRLSDDMFQYSLSFHHAILDGWSVASFHSELLLNYSYLINNRNEVLTLPKLTSHFKSVIAAEQAALQSATIRTFWSRYLDGHTLTVLPSHAPAHDIDIRPQIELTLPAESFAALTELANTLRVSVRTVFLTAHFKVLSVFSGCTDIVSGVVSHARPEQHDGERVLGLFLNTLPVRQKLRPCTWKKLITEVFNGELEVIPYRTFPYSEIFLENGRIPLYEVAFNYINFHVSEQLSDVTIVRELGRTIFEETSFGLITYVINQANSITLQLNYDPVRFSHTQVKQIGDCYLTVLESILQNPNAYHDAASYMARDDYQRAIVEWNQTVRSRTDKPSILRFFELHAEEHPLNTAVIFEDGTLTYGELNAKSNQLARHLRQLKAGPEMLIGLYVERSLDMLIGLIAVLKTGAAYLPLDPSYPKERLGYMIRVANPALILTQQHLSETLPKSSATPVCLDAERDKFLSYDKDNLQVVTRDHNLAYVMYTSGSTGRPKGIGQTILALSNLLEWEIASNQRLDGTGAVRVMQFASMNFDVSFQEIFTTLSLGNCLVVANTRTRQDLELLGQFVGSTHIDRLFLPNAVLQQLATYASPATQQESKFPREIISAGEQLVISGAVRRYVEKMHLSFLVNQYGPTETHVVTQFCIEPSSVSEQSVTVPIGKPIDNTQIYLLDGSLNPVPIGVSGELYIAGDGLARGYFNQPDLTAERFVPNPFGPAGSRMYKSGDLARYLSGGNIEYLGRIDNQVKIRGFRVELGEIESALSAIAGIRDAVVVTRDKAGVGLSLVAYVTMDKAAELSVLDIRHALFSELPDYMVPAHIMILDDFPLTPNGKVDRRALPEADMAQNDVDYVAPRTPTESALASIWAEVLAMDRVSVHDDFFSLGGHSLLAAQLIAKVRAVFKIQIFIETLFDGPKIEQFAQRVESLIWLNNMSQVEGIRDDDQKYEREEI